MSTLTDNSKAFQVSLTADFVNDDGSPRYKQMGLSVLDEVSHIQYKPLSAYEPTISSEQIAGVQGVIVLGPSVTSETVRQSDDLLAISRFGVGYDTVDVAACTQADVAVLIAAGAVDRSVAEATIGWMLGLTHRCVARINWFAMANGMNAQSIWVVNCETALLAQWVLVASPVKLYRCLKVLV